MLPWCNKKNITIAVIGDLILDEYLDGQVNRVSPEAPVCVHQVKNSFSRAGGAANAARNIRGAGGNAQVFGLIGLDASADTLLKILEDDHIATQGIIRCKNRVTSKKTRVYANHQQMLRVDWEEITQINEKEELELLDKLQSSEVNGFLVSDYGKGVLSNALLSQIFALAKKQNIPVVVDPKGKNFSKYQGCTVITPNKKEALEALGLDPNTDINPESIARQLQEKFVLNDILLTMGANGMLYLPKNQDIKAIYEAPKAREVFDVSGAGDTVAALIALGHAASTCHLEEIVSLANIAAGLVVEKWGTQAVEKAEIEDVLRLQNSPTFSSRRKIFSDPYELKAALEKVKKKEVKSVVFTNGCFDILHIGHIRYLEEAKAQGDILVLALNSDASIKKLKGIKRPIISEKERLEVMAGLACVDFVFLFHEDTPEEALRILQPDILVKGGDYSEKQIVGHEIVKAYGGKVKALSLTQGASTSSIVEKILAL